MSRVINVHRCDIHNIGDWFSTPVFYFDPLREVDRLDIWTTDFTPELLEDKIVVLGGGGLFGNVDFEARLQQIIDAHPRDLIAWGPGHNRHDGSSIDYPDYLDQFSLLGLRDYNVQGSTWVPCSSCMHSAFSREYPVTRHIVVYEHKDHRLDIPGYPKMDNRQEHLAEVAAFLGSAEVVITSTYHGAYWATLLNKKVVVVNPFSTKFLGLRHQPVFAETEHFKEVLGDAKNFPNALGECRDANRAFAVRVFNRIFGSGGVTETGPNISS